MSIILSMADLARKKSSRWTQGIGEKDSLTKVQDLLKVGMPDTTRLAQIKN